MDWRMMARTSRLIAPTAALLLLAGSGVAVAANNNNFHPAPAPVHVAPAPAPRPTMNMPRANPAPSFHSAPAPSFHPAAPSPGARPAPAGGFGGGFHPQPNAPGNTNYGGARPGMPTNNMPANNGAGGFRGNPATPGGPANYNYGGARPGAPVNNFGGGNFGGGNVGGGAARPGMPVNNGMNGGGWNRPGMPGAAGGFHHAGSPGFTQFHPAAGFNRINRPNGDVFQRRPGGGIADVHNTRLGMDIHHSLMGGRRIETMRPGGVRIVAERGRPGFVSRPFARSFGGHDFTYRTYYYHGRPYERFYRGYGFRGVSIEVYAPARYYHPGFYGWAYRPWGRPVVYAWGWNSSPWYGYYGGYWVPAATYDSPSYWLTDYMIGSDLQAEYVSDQEAGVAPTPVLGNSPMITPEIRQAISSEVSSQIALENYEAQQNASGQDADPASSGIVRILTDGRAHVFVAGSNLDVVNTAGNECALTPGDVLQFAPPSDPNSQMVNLTVLASKGGRECMRSDTVMVSLYDLQEMQNQMRQGIDEGLAKLKDLQGKDGLPPAPPAAVEQTTNAQFTTVAPPPDPDASTEISQQDAVAATAENEVASGS